MQFLSEINAALESGLIILPLSAIHFLETLRISNGDKRVRLGNIMWKYSKGARIVSSSTIVRHELEVALSKHFKHITPCELNLLGSGLPFTFDTLLDIKFPDWLEDEFERSVLTGEAMLGDKPPRFYADRHREGFKNHLDSVHNIKNILPKEKWDNALVQIALQDISHPIMIVMQKYNLPPESLGNLGASGMRGLIENMPSRKFDFHMHRQVLKNPNYRSKNSDMEDWAGVGMAAQYCDMVICEKHMADMMKRDGFKTKAKIQTNLLDLFTVLRSK